MNQLINNRKMGILYQILDEVKNIMEKVWPEHPDIN